MSTDLIGKPITELTPAELASLASQLATITQQVDTRRKEIQAGLEKDQFGKLAQAGKEVAQAMGWGKLPKLQLIPDEAGTTYTVVYVVTKRKGNGGKRATLDVNGGKITINKIGLAMGGIAFFTVKSTGKSAETLKELIVEGGLKNPETGRPEGERCYDITKSGGIAASDIVVKYHPDDVVLTFQDGREMTVKDAAEALKTARASA